MSSLMLLALLDRPTGEPSQEANGFCRVLDLYARAWDENRADFGFCGQLQVSYDAENQDALLVDGVTLRRCEGAAAAAG